MPGDVELVEALDLPATQAAQAAELAYLAFEDFYANIVAPRGKLFAAIAKQFASHSELNQLVAAMDQGRVIGIGAYYGLGETAVRQMEGLRMLLEAADDPGASARALRAFSRNFPPAGSEGGYISRFAVSPAARGTGLAAEMLARVEAALARMGHAQVRLHVRRENARALAFYRKSGYEAAGPVDLGYLLLGKPIE